MQISHVATSKGTGANTAPYVRLWFLLPHPRPTLVSTEMRQQGSFNRDLRLLGAESKKILVSPLSDLEVSLAQLPTHLSSANPNRQTGGEGSTPARLTLSRQGSVTGVLPRLPPRVAGGSHPVAHPTRTLLAQQRRQCSLGE